MLKTLRTIAVLACLPACAPGCPGYVWMQGERISADNRYAEGEGHSTFLRAEQDRKVRVLEAQAALESAKLQADAEVERAKGVAAANKIIGESLHQNEAYLRWLWIKELSEAGHNTPQVIYVPTEAGLPILEAGHRPEPRK